MSSQSKTDGSNALKERRIIVIEATQKQEQKKLRVAGYARVSSDSSDQLNSFTAQNTYFTKLIESNDQWEMVDVYADEGISGRSAEKRGDFQRMIADCERGKIDRIITKSISRFARNAKECLTIIRHLKSIGVSIYFEEQNIDTSIVTGEMLTAVFAGLAQAESESIAKNMRWSYEKRMASGEFNTCKNPLSYRMVKGQLEVDENEAAIVRMIFRDYLSGKSCEAIGAKLREMGVQSRDGKNAWRPTAISYILSNERYIGNALLQKRYTTESFPPKRKQNRGEVPQYYVEGSNPPIIDEETFAAANDLLKSRSEKVSRKRNDSPFTQKIRCGQCGTLARRKNENAKAIWVCYTHSRDAALCPIGPVPEREIKNAFLRLCFKLKLDNMSILRELEKDLTQLRNRKLLWSVDVIELNKRISDIAEQDQQLSELNSLGLADPDFYISQKNELAEQMRQAKLEKERLMSAKDDDSIKDTKRLIEALEDRPAYLDEFDDGLFEELVTVIIIEDNTHLRFQLRNGLELQETIEGTVR